MGSATGRFAKVGDFVTRTIADETIVVPVRSGVGDLDSIYTFNEIGAFVWSLIDGSRTLEDIVAAIAAEFEVDIAEARGDALEFVGTLAEAGLIRQAEEERG
jgi:hypothetical protein